MKLNTCLYLILIYLLSVGNSFADNNPSNDLRVYKKHIRYTKEQHKLLSKSLKRIQKKTKGDSVFQFAYINKDYTDKCSNFNYLDKKKRVITIEDYKQSITHLGLIESTIKKLRKTTQKEVSQKRLNIKTLQALQKESVYGQAKHKYLKQVKYKDLLSKIKFKKLEQLRRSQQQFVMKLTPQSNLNIGKENFAIPKFEFPAQVQTLSKTNQILQVKSNSDKPSLNEKFKNAINNPLGIIIDTINHNNKDSLLFKPNPYKVMPFTARLKFGFDNQINNINSGGKLLLYTLNVRYLLMDNVIPTLGVGFGHSLFKKGDGLTIQSEQIQARFGVESKIYKSIGGFINAEFTSSFKAKDKLSNDFVFGLTNFNGDKSRLKIWIGFSVYGLFEGNSNPFIFRIGL